jgi:creatinine deaminase
MRNAGLRNFNEVTLYTTVSPCLMCIGGILFVGIRRLVIGDRRSFAGHIKLLLSRGVEVTLLDDSQCYELMAEFMNREPQFWRNFASGSPLLFGSGDKRD